MKPEQLALLKVEYTKAKEGTNRSRYSAWSEACREYRFDNALEVWEYLMENITSNTGDALLATDGRLPTLNIMARKFVTFLTSGEPDFALKNEAPENEAIAWLLEPSVRDLLRRVKFADLERQWALDAFLFGIAISKVGWRSEYVPGEEAYSGEVPDDVETVDYGDDEWPEGPYTEYANLNVTQGDVYVGRVPPYDFFIDPGATCDTDVRRYYIRYRRRVKDIQMDVRYNKNARAQIKGQSFIDDDIVSQFVGAGGEDAELCRAEVVECFDLSTGKYCVFNEYCDEALRDWEFYPLPIGTPLSFYKPIDSPDSFWPPSMSRMLLPLTRARNQIRAKVLDGITKDGKRVFMANPSVMDERVITDVNNAPNNSFVMNEHIDTTKPLETYVHVVEFGGASEHVSELLREFDNDAQYVSQMSDPTLNVYRPGRQSATEISERAQRQDSTAQQYLTGFERFEEETVRKACKVMLDNWDPERLVRIVGQDPRIEFWARVPREKLVKDFTIEIVKGTREKLDSVAQKRQILELLPRIMEMAAAIDQEQAMTQQTGQPSIIDRVELLRVMLESFDPRLADKVIRRKDPITLLQRLVQQHSYSIENRLLEYVSPELIARLNGMPSMPSGASMPMMGGGGQPAASFEERNRVPAPATPQFGQFNQYDGGGVTGRALSEFAQ